MKDRIYFDNAATTAMDERVLQEMLPFLKDSYGNPNGKYSIGYEARKAVNEARRKAACLINAEPDEIYFTSGGTEGNNTVINGFLSGLGLDDVKSSVESGQGMIVSSEIEHDSVLNPIKEAARKGIKHILLKPEENGVISPEGLERMISQSGYHKNGLVSIMLVNNEIGTVEPVKELAEIAHSQGFLFHTDAVQAAGHMRIDVKELGPDMMSLSGHKLYGPKGTGLLYVKRGVKLKPLIFGGRQERGLRSGTENVPGIVGLGKACELVKEELDVNLAKEQEVGRYIIDRVLKTIPGAKQNGEGDRILNFSFEGANGTSLALRLDMEGICVSTGSACSSGLDERSHVLTAIGLPDKEADSSIRISIGKYNTIQEAERLALVLERLVAELRSYYVQA